MPENNFYDKSKTDSVNGLVPSGNKWLPEQMLTLIYAAINVSHLMCVLLVV